MIRRLPSLLVALMLFASSVAPAANPPALTRSVESAALQTRAGDADLDAFWVIVEYLLDWLRAHR